jgi:hypothetical protein
MRDGTAHSPWRGAGIVNLSGKPGQGGYSAPVVSERATKIDAILFRIPVRGAWLDD